MAILMVEIDVITGEETTHVLTPHEEEEYLASISPPSVSTNPDPKGFYNKATGVYGDTFPLALLFSSLFKRSLDQTQDTSALVAALVYFNACLNNNDWTQPIAKESYMKAYEVLKPFLSIGQISIIDEENIAYRLV